MKKEDDLKVKNTQSTEKSSSENGSKEPERQLTADDLNKVKAQWASVVAMDPSFETQGVLLFRNIFTLAPAALEFFSFKDEENLYESEKLKKHGAAVFKSIEAAVVDFAGVQQKVIAMGDRHNKKGILTAHYEVVGQAVLQTLGMALGDQFTDEMKTIWTMVYVLVQKTMQTNSII